MSAAAVLVLVSLGCRADGSTSTGPEAQDATTLKIFTVTSGDSLDSDGYTVSVDGGSGQRVGINDTTVFANLAAEDHTVELSGVASNCSLSGSNPRTVTAAENDTTPTSFDISCEASSSSSASVFREHEPEDMTKISENPSNVTEPSGWSLISSNYDIATDSEAPHSPSNIGRWTFPQGSVDSGSLNLGSLATSDSETGMRDATYNDVYLDIYIKLSSNFQYHDSSTNKMVWFISKDISGSNPMYLNAKRDEGEGDSGPAEWTINKQSPNSPNRTFKQNVNPEKIALGEWVHIEILLIRNTDGASDGETHMWINGNKRIEYTDVEWFATQGADWDAFKVNPVWGGQNDTVQETMYMYHDHIYLSGR